MPKLRRRFSSVSAPFCWPTTATRWPPIIAKPATIASSSPNTRSPWSSMNSSAMTPSSSSVRGRRRLRASWTRAQLAAFGSGGGSAATSAAGAASRTRLRMRSTMDGLRRDEEAEELGDLATEIGAGDHAVDEPVAEQELGALEAGRQLLADGARADACPGEPDEGVGLGEVHVAHGRVARERAAGRRVGHDRDVRDARLAQALEGAHRLGELHQRERALLHPCAARRGDDDQRQALVERGLRGSRDLLADDGAH